MNPPSDGVLISPRDPSPIHRLPVEMPQLLALQLLPPPRPWLPGGFPPHDSRGHSQALARVPLCPCASPGSGCSPQPVDKTCTGEEAQPPNTPSGRRAWGDPQSKVTFGSRRAPVTLVLLPAAQSSPRLRPFSPVLETNDLGLVSRKHTCHFSGRVLEPL